jgi:hypothetical protein
MATTVVFFGMIITHGLTTLGTVLGSFSVGLYKRRFNLFTLFGVAFLIWISMFVPYVLDKGVIMFMGQIVNADVFAFLNSPGYRAVSSLSGEIGKWTRLFFPLVDAILLILAGILFLAGKVSTENRNRVAMCFAWIVGIVLLLAVSVGWSTEVDWRVYMFLLLPVATVIVLAFRGVYQKLLIILAVFFIILSIPANYHTDFMEQTRTTEIKSAEFFADNVKPTRDIYNVRGLIVPAYVEYYNPATIYNIYWTSVPLDENFAVASQLLLDKSDFIYYGIRTHNTILYTYSTDTVQEWLDANKNQLELIYDNGNYQIYRQLFVT